MAAEHAQRQRTSESGYAIWQDSSNKGHTKNVSLVEHQH